MKFEETEILGNTKWILKEVSKQLQGSNLGNPMFSLRVFQAFRVARVTKSPKVAGADFRDCLILPIFMVWGLNFKCYITDKSQKKRTERSLLST